MAMLMIVNVAIAVLSVLSALFGAVSIRSTIAQRSQASAIRSEIAAEPIFNDTQDQGLYSIPEAVLNSHLDRLADNQRAGLTSILSASFGSLFALMAGVLSLLLVC